jgi:hypothetical protein
MRTIIAGSRSCTDYSILEEAIKSCGWTPTIVISGNARGADILGEMWAKNNNVPREIFPAKWDIHGKSAGYIRNTEMVENAEAVIALWDGKSRGTQHTINLATKKGLTCYVHNYSINNPSTENLTYGNLSDLES